LPRCLFISVLLEPRISALQEEIITPAGKVASEAHLQDLDGEPLTGYLLIGGQVHHAHPPFTELTLDAVSAAQQLTDCQPNRVG